MLAVAAVSVWVFLEPGRLALLSVGEERVGLLQVHVVVIRHIKCAATLMQQLLGRHVWCKKVKLAKLRGALRGVNAWFNRLVQESFLVVPRILALG